jgi:hypothetical protein
LGEYISSNASKKKRKKEKKKPFRFYSWTFDLHRTAMMSCSIDENDVERKTWIRDPENSTEKFVLSDRNESAKFLQIFVKQSARFLVRVARTCSTKRSKIPRVFSSSSGWSTVTVVVLRVRRLHRQQKHGDGYDDGRVFKPSRHRFHVVVVVVVRYSSVFDDLFFPAHLKIRTLTSIKACSF